MDKMDRMKVNEVLQILHLANLPGSPLSPVLSCIVLAFPYKNMTRDCGKVWQDIRCSDLKLHEKRGEKSWKDIFTLQRAQADCSVQ